MTDHSTEQKGMFGFWAYIMSDCVLFAGLFASYAALRSATAGGPEGAELFSLPYVLLQTLVLLTSSATYGLGLIGAERRHRGWVLWSLGTTLILGLAFLGLELNEFSRLIIEGNGPARSAFLSSFFALVGTHGLHVALGSLWMLVVGAHVLIRGLTAGTTRKLHYLGLFWHFLDVIWIFIFTFVYLMGVI